MDHFKSFLCTPFTSDDLDKIKHFKSGQDNDVRPTGLKNNNNGAENVVESLLSNSKIITNKREATKLVSFQIWKDVEEKLKSIRTSSDHIHGVNYYKINKDVNLQDGELIIVSQPYGSQMPPDFLIFVRLADKLVYFCLEIKSSKTNKSMWNGSFPLPLPYYFYIHISMKKNKFVCYQGSEFMPIEEYNGVLNILRKWEELCETMKNNNQKIVKFRPRKALEQIVNYDFTKQTSYTEQIDQYFTSLNETVSSANSPCIILPEEVDEIILIKNQCEFFMIKQNRRCTKPGKKQANNSCLCRLHNKSQSTG